jgi:hypothetical protein
MSGTNEKKKKTLQGLPTSGLSVAVINYESAWRLEKELATWKPDLIICDEGHKIMNHNTSASKSPIRQSTCRKPQTSSARCNWSLLP